MCAKAIVISAIIGALLPISVANAADSCIFVRNINDWKAAKDEKSIVLRDSPSRRYTINFVGRCVGLRFSEAIVVRSFGGQFCLQPGDSIFFSDAGVRRQCMIDKISPLAAGAPSDAPADQPAQNQPQGY